MYNKKNVHVETDTCINSTMAGVQRTGICRHHSVLVVLNPSRECHILEEHTSNQGDIIANICARCCKMVEGENIFGMEKRRSIQQDKQYKLLPWDKETLIWLQKDVLPSVSKMDNKGIYINAQVDLKFPSNAKTIYRKREPTVTIGKTGGVVNEKIPIRIVLAECIRRLNRSLNS
jgi:hypothetical protein